MLSNLFVPVDFSPSSTNAFLFAARIARIYHSKITVFHAYRLEIIEPYMAVEMQMALQQQEQVLAGDYFSSLGQSLPPEVLEGLEIHYELAMGVASEEIIYRTEALKPDLIVMGMRGSNPHASQLLGSVTTSVIQRTQVPMLVIPDKAEYAGFKQIAYATHLEGEDLHVIDEMLPFATDNMAVLSCVHVKDGTEQKLSPRLELLERAYAHEVLNKRIAFEMVDNEDVLQGINEYVSSHNIDLLVMLTHSRSLLGKMLHKSYATRMARQTHIPLWIYPMKQ